MDMKNSAAIAALIPLSWRDFPERGQSGPPTHLPPQALDAIEWDEWMMPTAEGYLFGEEQYFDPEVFDQENVVQTRTQTNKFKAKGPAAPHNNRAKMIPSNPKVATGQAPSAQQANQEQQPISINVVNPSKSQNVANTQIQMAYDVVDDLRKVQITLPFLEVAKIPQQRQNLPRLLNTGIPDPPNMEASS